MAKASFAATTQTCRHTETCEGRDAFFSRHPKEDMKTLSKLLVMTAITAASAANAQTYGEIGYTSVTTKENLSLSGSTYNIKASPTALRGIFGYELNPNLAIEALGAFGLSDSTIKANGVSVSGFTMEIDNVIGVYLKPKTQLNGNLELFGRVGFAHSKGTASAAGVASSSASENGFSYGAGLSYAINPTTSLNADYMSYLNKDGFKANGFTFGVGFKF
jgi:opacity protein-like surface antigen